MLAPSFPARALAVLSLTRAVYSQSTPVVPNTFPHDYPGKPTGDFSPEWQDYFQVKAGTLPNVTFPLSNNWAGNIPVNRTNHPNDTLFFWAFETANGSLTQPAGSNPDQPWAIWLNGESSSMLGLMLENGPLHVAEDGSIISNNASWDKLVDHVWIDQPVGVGFSTADAAGGYVQNEDEIAEDFVNFLASFVKIFPSLATRPLLLTGQSYAGRYIPYIMKAIFSAPNPPVRLSRVAIGNGAIGSIAEYELLPALSIIETYPQLIGYDQEVYQYFKEQNHLCGYDLNLTYPQGGKFPSLKEPQQPDEPIQSIQLKTRAPALTRMILNALAHGEEAPAVGLVRRHSSPTHEEIAAREARRQLWIAKQRNLLKARDLTGRANGTIDPFYGCFLSNEIQDYALNFSMPWNLSVETQVLQLNYFGPYNIHDLKDARVPRRGIDPLPVWMTDNRTRTALHAPTGRQWVAQTAYPFNSSFQSAHDPSVEPMAFLDELASNATQHGVKMIIYAGNDDSTVSHLSSEITIQNTTFGGIQGFTRKPSTPWHDDSGNFAGIVHQERNWTYILVAKAGHRLPEGQPQTAYVMYREFILGNNQTGFVADSGTAAVGGEDPSLLIGPNNVLPGETSILYGSGTATSFFAAPTATIDAWNSYFATAASRSGAAPSTTSGGTGGHSSGSSSLRETPNWPVWCAAIVSVLAIQRF
ncbi:alpha/beta-hydrolase [Trametopsis cervina]|nr:alpha/beta-hydrolase [Trametopsis cervina]